jgi:hypothetical protein
MLVARVYDNEQLKPLPRSATPKVMRVLVIYYKSSRHQKLPSSKIIYQLTRKEGKKDMQDQTRFHIQEFDKDVNYISELLRGCLVDL